MWSWISDKSRFHVQFEVCIQFNLFDIKIIKNSIMFFWDFLISQNKSRFFCEIYFVTSAYEFRIIIKSPMANDNAMNLCSKIDRIARRNVIASNKMLNKRQFQFIYMWWIIQVDGNEIAWKCSFHLLIWRGNDDDIWVLFFFFCSRYIVVVDAAAAAITMKENSLSCLSVYLGCVFIFRMRWIFKWQHSQMIQHSLYTFHFIFIAFKMQTAYR